MSLFEDPRQLIYELVPKFKSHGEIHQLSTLVLKLTHIQALQKQQISEATQHHHNLKKKVEKVKFETHRPNHCSLEKFHERLETLESEKFSMGKTIQDLETTLEKLEREFQQVSHLYQQYKTSNTKSTEASEETLKLRIYRSLGVTLQEGKKIRLHSLNKNDIHSLNVDPEKYSWFFYTNYVWEMISSE